MFTACRPRTIEGAAVKARFPVLLMFSSELQLDAEFQQPSVEDVLWRQPGRTVGQITLEDGARVQCVVDVEVSFDPDPPHAKDLRHANVELINPVIKLRKGSDQLDRRRSDASGQVAAQRWRNCSR